MNYLNVISAIVNARSLMLVIGVIMLYAGYRAVKDRTAGMLNIMTLAENTYGKWAVVYGLFWIILGSLLTGTSLFAVNAENTVIWRVLKCMG